MFAENNFIIVVKLMCHLVFILLNMLCLKLLEYNLEERNVITVECNGHPDIVFRL